MACLETCFGALDDPRAGNASHRLIDLIVIMLAASLCGASTATEFALFAETRKAALSHLISYDRVPSHDTFSRLLRLLDPHAFAAAFAVFADGFSRAMARRKRPALIGKVVALDGKTLRRAYERGCQASPPLTVSAFASEARLCLAAVTAGTEDNEVEAALAVIHLIDLTDKIVTADALHCHHRMAEAITLQGGDFVLALKANRHQWHAAAQASFAAKRKPAMAQATVRAHGRKEWRRAEIIKATPLVMGHKAFIRVTSKRDQAEPVTRFFMASKMLSAKDALAVTRAHWQIENGLHWVLDVHLDEDLCRARKDNAPANVALLNRIARNILQAIDLAKVPISHRLKKCAWSDDHLVHALAHMR